MASVRKVPCVRPRVLRYEKINPDPYAYAKRTARRVAATPARRSHPVGPSRTPQAHACRLLEDPHLAISCAHGTNARRLHGRRQQIHDDLRIQHPEWVERNGESSMRLMELLDTLTRRGSKGE